MDAGAVGWLVPDHPIPNSDQRQMCRISPAGAASGELSTRIAIPACDQWNYLTHCTRSVTGPWPEQDESEYLDELILDRPETDHSAAATLERILRERRLVASGRGSGQLHRRPTGRIRSTPRLSHASWPVGF